jgi:hypothetical protein
MKSQIHILKTVYEQGFTLFNCIRHKYIEGEGIKVMYVCIEMKDYQVAIVYEGE